MEPKPSPFSKKHYRHRKGIPDIPYRSRPAVSTDWPNEIDRLEKFFADEVLATQPLKLNAWTTIIDLAGCIESGMNYVKGNNGNRTFLPYLEQLQEIEQVLLPENEREERKAELIPQRIKPNIQKVNSVKKQNKSVRKERLTKQIPKWDYESFYDD